MALTIVVRSVVAKGGVRELSLPAITVDAPRIVVGRGDGCEVRLPDLSVGHRHASFRQKGGDWVVVDEGSQNGTFVQKVRLPPQTAENIKSGDLIRLGRVWIEVRIEPAPPMPRSPAAAAKELALELTARALEADGEVPWPKVTVVAGPDRGAALVLDDATRTYAIGRSRDCDLVLSDPDAGRRHATLTRRGDALGVQDLGSSRETLLEGAPLGAGEVAWRVGQELAIAGTVFALEHPAAEALAEIERSPEERIRETEMLEPPASATASTEPTGDALVDTPAAAPADATERQRAAPLQRAAAKEKAGWGGVDGIVVVIALGVLAVSVAAALWLLGR